MSTHVWLTSRAQVQVAERHTRGRAMSAAFVEASTELSTIAETLMKGRNRATPNTEAC